MSYSDDHPDVRDHVVTVTTPEGRALQYMPRERWERVVVERDEYRRVLAMISAWRLTPTGVRGDTVLDQLLARVGETYERARATQDVISWARSTASQDSKEN